MSVKFGRNYRLQVELNNGEGVEIEYPLTLEFNIVRRAYTSLGTCTFRIYNLQLSRRIGIQRDWNNFEDTRYLRLKAGYGPYPWPFIFNGNVKQAYSWRESGSVDGITEIQGWDNGYSVITSFTNTTLQGEVSKQSVINSLITNLTGKSPTLGVGYVSPFLGVYPRGRTLFGPTWQLLQTETDRNCFIDNGNVYALKQNEVFVGGIREINSTTGLLSTPRRTQTYLTVEILFEPNIVIGQIIHLNTETAPQFNGTYKVMGLEHRGIISGAVNGKCTTTLFLFFGTDKLTEVFQPGLPEGVIG